MLMLPGDDEWIWQLAGETIWRPVVDTIANRVGGGIDARIADVVARAVFEVNDREEVLGVFVAILSLGEMEGALTGDVGRWRRGCGAGRRRGYAAGRRRCLC